MNLLVYLFLSRLPYIEEESRFIAGKEQPCLVIPTETNQIKRGKQGNWLMMMRLAEREPNVKQITHDVQLSYLNQKDLDLSYQLGYHERTAHLGRVYVHDRTPSKKINRTNNSTDIRCDGVIILSDIPKHLIFRNAENAKRYVTGLKFKSVADNNIIYTGTICIDDIPVCYILTDPNTGKKYVNARFRKLDSLDTYMNTHQLVIVTEDSELEIGRFKEWVSINGTEVKPFPVALSEEDGHIDSRPSDTPLEIDGLKF